MSFQNRVVLVTGGSSGIGLATAQLFGELGAHVWLMARNRLRLEEAVEQVRASCAGCHGAPSQVCGGVVADVADPDAVARAVAEVTAAVGPPDILINSAGIVSPGYFVGQDLDVFRDTMAIDYFGTLYSIKAVVPAMIRRGSGHIVNVSSGAGFLPVYGYSTYAPAKYAVRGLSDVLRVELKPYGIRVSVVYPADTDTPQLAFERPLKPPEARAFASSPMPPARVAQAIIRGIEHNHHTILPGLEMNLLYRLVSLLGDWQYPIMDRMIARAQQTHNTTLGGP